MARGNSRAQSEVPTSFADTFGKLVDFENRFESGPLPRLVSGGDMLRRAIKDLKENGLNFPKYDPENPFKGGTPFGSKRGEVYASLDLVLSQFSDKKEFAAFAQLLGAGKKSSRDEEDIMKMSPSRIIEWAKELGVGPYRYGKESRNKSLEELKPLIQKQVESDYQKLLKSLPRDVQDSLVSRKLPTEDQQTNLSSLLKGKYAQDPVLLATLGMVSRDRNPWAENLGLDEKNTHHFNKAKGIYLGNHTWYDGSGKRSFGQANDPAGYERSPLSIARNEVIKDIGKPESQWSRSTKEAVASYRRETAYRAAPNERAREELIEADRKERNQEIRDFYDDMRATEKRLGDY